LPGGKPAPLRPCSRHSAAMKAYLSSGRGMGRERLGAFDRDGAGERRRCDRSGTGFGGRIDQAPVGPGGIARRLLGAGRMQHVRRCCIRHLADLGRRRAQGSAAPARRAGLRGVYLPSAAAGPGRGRRRCSGRGASGRGSRSWRAGGRSGRHRHRSTDDGFTSGQCAQYAIAAARLRSGG
jgi:hypothetical protein